MNIQKYIEIRRQTSIEKISLGYRTLELFSPSELAQEQIGYSVGEAGESFAGGAVGDWKSDWLVVGKEDLLGDPIFVDLSHDDLPVYTAAHGAGSWNPMRIASSFNGFIQALHEIDRLGERRRNPVELERNPVAEDERRSLLDHVSAVNKEGSLEFWENWLDV